MFTASYDNSTFDLIAVENAQLTDGFGKLLQLIKPKGYLFLQTYVGKTESLLQELKMNGFINSLEDSSTHGLLAQKPGYETGSAVKLSFAKKPTNSVWKISGDDAVEQADTELIDEYDLLDEEDKQMPDPSSLRGKIDCLKAL